VEEKEEGNYWVLCMHERDLALKHCFVLVRWMNDLAGLVDMTSLVSVDMIYLGYFALKP